jgi:spore coat protein CotH
MLAITTSVLATTAFAAEDAKSKEEITLEQLLPKALYVEKDKKAGLRSEVRVAVDFPAAGGVLYLPGSADTDALRFSWDSKGVTFRNGGKTYKSGKAPIAKAGESITYTVSNGSLSAPLTIRTIKGSPNVDAMFLEIDESKGSIPSMQLDLSQEAAVYGKVKVGDHKKKYIKLKGRGNSTWFMPKKPYNFTVYDDDTYSSKDKTQLIDGVKAKKWSLLANYYDNSLMRNKIAQDLASDLGIGLKTKFVDLWMNGTFLGNYLLTPKKDYQCADNGYVLENDNYEEEEGQFAISGIHEMAGNHNLITVRDIGDEAVAAGVDTKSIEKWFKKAWAAALDYESEDYQNYFDLDSWAKMYLMYEVSKTYSCYSGSLFMHRDGLTAKDKLKAGPAWDYDIAFGRTLHKFRSGADVQIQMTAEGWYIDNTGEYGSEKPATILQALGRHKSFMKQVSKVYNENKKAFEGIGSNIDRQAKILKKSAVMNNALFGTNSLSAEYVIAPNTMKTIGTGKYKLDYRVTLTWDDYIHNLREYCRKRTMWLSDHLAPGVKIDTYQIYPAGTK